MKDIKDKYLKRYTIKDSIVGGFVLKDTSFLYTIEYTVFDCLGEIILDKMECYPRSDRNTVRNEVCAVLIDRGFYGYNVKWFEE